jgi:hypothetical protein
MLSVWAIWHQSVEDTGTVAGTSANDATRIAKWLNFPVSLLAERLLNWTASSEAAWISMTLSRFGVKTPGELFLWVYWPALFFLGGLQWIVLGYVIARFLKRPEQSSPLATSTTRRGT